MFAGPQFLEAVLRPETIVKDQWIYRIGGQELGPVTFQELVELAKQSRLSADDQIRLHGSRLWRRAGSIGRLMAVFPFEVPARESAPVIADLKPSTSTKPSQRSVAKVELKPKQPSQPAGQSRARTDRFPIPESTKPKAPAVEAPKQTISTTPGQAAAELLQNLAAPASDSTVTDNIRREFAARAIPSLARLDVTLHMGTVTLGGRVSSEGERLLAVRIAERFIGGGNAIDVLSVENPAAHPRVRPASRISIPVRTESSGGILSGMIEKVRGEYLRHAIAALVATAALGYWFYPRGPVRPVAVHPVGGKVIMDGKPLANAAIVLHRVGESKVPANLHPRATAAGDGTFKLETFDPADGAPEGEFVATVFLTEESVVDGEKQAGPNILPAVYSKPETSPLKLKITSSTRELQPLQLTNGPGDLGG